MADSKGRVVVEAHTLRTATAKAALLHGSRRGPRELRRPYAAVIASLVLGALLLVAVWAITSIGGLLAEQRRQRALDRPPPAAVLLPAPPGSTGRPGEAAEDRDHQGHQAEHRHHLDQVEELP
ncbi:hypothetical protein ACN28C_24870 [Plantactinospora sp. WMMC1484]|uniref:hypothetical protein n=1 Tax=Plantactinospora sp. WMMC1484 TaxID=3404122 RepID=UPI003BF5B3AC